MSAMATLLLPPAIGCRASRYSDISQGSLRLEVRKGCRVGRCVREPCHFHPGDRQRELATNRESIDRQNPLHPWLPTFKSTLNSTHRHSVTHTHTHTRHPIERGRLLHTSPHLHPHNVGHRFDRAAGVEEDGLPRKPPRKAPQRPSEFRSPS